MTASRSTITDVYAVLRRHADRDAITRILRELLDVDGNQSFRSTVGGLYNLHP